MLDSETKRRIDACRDILVGKVPDPKSQVEQITIALIYKFMDDMDAEAEELGGRRSFFAGDHGKYGWARLMAPRMGGFDMLALYSEAIGRMNENPGIPPLFRDIFKNAYLPYRDPETLRAFLKEIDGFTYDHSERLGDAFEYLLSVLGSQGDAGQFRTPRHIIDFMVEVIDPKKNESILDPACGTAGFLISAWKHILGHNTRERAGDLLTPEERATLVANIQGYDISPDMVRLSLVNLYLHGFSDPHIVEYDTLTSEERWHEHADIILANPPFMSPKGGIKPHKRFSVPATRSEVLFVDYMAEHLSPQGRAAIVVPEGIIFQGGTAYKKLREMLVRTSLVAVVSLPAGVFNPYSGVKTSILILDKRLAKTSDAVLFVKVRNDGFNLGAQRRAVVGSDLPEAAKVLREWTLGRFDGTSPLVTRVARERIGENGEWNLSGERYRKRDAADDKFELVTLGAICKPEYGFTATAEDVGPVRFIRITDINSYGELKKDGQKYIALNSESEPYLLRKGDLLVARTGATFGKTMLFAEDYPAIFASYLIRLRFSKDRLLPKFYWAFAQTEKYWKQAKRLVSGGGQPQFNGNAITQIEVPLPPLTIQQEIVAEIESYQKIVDGARQVIANYQPHIPIHPDWPMVALREIVDELESGVSVNSENRTAHRKEIGILKTSCVSSGVFDPLEHKVVLPEETGRVRCPVRGNTIIISRMNTEALVGANAFVAESHPHLYLPDRLWQTVISRSDVEVQYLQTVLTSKLYRQKMSAVCSGTSGSMKNISKPQLLSLTIPLPPLETQRTIVAEIQAEQALVKANQQLIERFEARIKAAINRVWGQAE